MTKITGTETIRTREEALELYNKLDNAGYNVSLSSNDEEMYELNYVGYSNTIPMDNIER